MSAKKKEKKNQKQKTFESYIRSITNNLHVSDAAAINDADTKKLKLSQKELAFNEKLIFSRYYIRVIKLVSSPEFILLIYILFIYFFFNFELNWSW